MSIAGSRGPAGSKIPKGYAAGSLAQYTPEQMNLFQSLFSQVSPDSKLAGLARGDEGSFQALEQSAMRGFQNLQGQNASRFSQLAPGAMSATRGSGFKNFQNQSTQDFALSLANQRQSLQQQALMDLMGISQTLLGARPYENFLVQKQKKVPFWQKLLGAASPIAGAALGGTFGGIPGAQLGGQLGGSFAQGFNG